MAGLRKLVTAFASQPGIICLHGGFPPAHTFPVKKMTLTLDDGKTIVIDDPAKVTIPTKQRQGALQLSLSNGASLLAVLC